MKVASFFSGCGGLDLGFKQAGFEIILANDNWLPAFNSYKMNFPETNFLFKDIGEITREEILAILKKQKIKKIDVVIGGPPCQCFTRLNNNNLKKSDKRNTLFREYIKKIRLLNPDFVVMENVADLLVRKNEKGILFKDMICKSFNRAGYRVAYKVFETEKYGVPQKRRRVIFLATRKKNIDITFPKESSRILTVGDALKKLKKYRTLKNHEITVNFPETLERIKHIPQGGYYAHLPEHLKTKKIRNGKLVTVKRYGSYYRRLHNDEPSVTITNNYFIHPLEDRFLSNREEATIHTFPTNFEFFGGTEDVSQQIANAVPPEFARRIAIHIIQELT